MLHNNQIKYPLGKGVLGLIELEIFGLRGFLYVFAREYTCYNECNKDD